MYLPTKESQQIRVESDGNLFGFRLFIFPNVHKLCRKMREREKGSKS
jgi:hypothetical protein